MPPRAAQEEYQDRLRRCEADLASLERRDRRLGDARVAVFVLAAAAVWPTLMSRIWHPAWLALAAAVFAGLVVAHGRVVVRRDRRRLAAGLYAGGLRRLAGEHGDPLDDGERFGDDDHPYTADLDLFGPFSLYELLCTARSLPGREALAAWLAAPATPPEIAARQEAVAELRGGLDLQEELQVLAADLSPEIRAAELDDWGRRPRQLAGWTVPAAASLLAAANVAVLAAWLFGPLPGRWALPVLALGGLLALALRPRVGAALDGLGWPAGELRFLARALDLLERERFSSPLLRDLQRRSSRAQDRPSARLRELARLIEWNDSRANLFFQPIAVVLLLGTQLGFAAERWRARHGAAIGGWLRAVGELEALASLAGFAYENPDFVFPEIEQGPAGFAAEGLVHPLLPRAARVANDVSLASGRGGAPPQLLVVSGSNMSGKSTLLRTVGVAAVLAQAGAPVPAARLRMTPLAVGASIRLHESLLEGVSRFYGELRRLSGIAELAAAGPTLFLLDEILHGTNSHDRRLGAAGVLRGLLDGGAIGLVTTHDLALAEIADELGPRAANVHFEDHLEEGQMAFDYRLRPGPVERGNALALMRSLGLPVEQE